MSIRRVLRLLLALAVTAGALGPAWGARAQTTTTAPPLECEPLTTRDDLLVRYCRPEERTSDTSSFPLRIEVTNSRRNPITNVAYDVTSVALEVLPTLAHQEAAKPPSLSWRGTTSTARIEWSPTFTTNGPYDLRIAARGDAPGGQASNHTVVMRLAAPPQPPAGVKAAKTDDGTVVVSWSNADREPDLLSYEVRRAAEGAATFQRLGAVEAAQAPRFVDDPGPGTWRYRVVALRRGATGQDDPAVASSPAVATVEVRPAETAAAGGGGGGEAGSGDPAPARDGAASGPGTSSTPAAGDPTSTTGPVVTPAGRQSLTLGTIPFGGGTRRPATAPRRNERDPGFDPTLPFDVPDRDPEPLPDDEPAEVVIEEEEEVAGQALITDGSGERRRSLGFVAGSLLLFVLAMTGFFLRAEVRRADDLEALDPAVPSPEDPPVQAPPAPAVVAAVAPPAPSPDAVAVAAAAAVPAAGRFRPRIPRRRTADADGAPLDGRGHLGGDGAVDDDAHLAALAAPLAPAVDRRPGGRVRRTVAPIDAPDLDVPEPAVAAPSPPPPTRTRTTDRARRASPRLPSRPADDRREGGAAVRPRRRRAGQGDGRLPVG